MNKMTANDFKRIRGESLKIGNHYVYWNKSVYEHVASPKECILVSFHRNWARVSRLDLTTNRIQSIEISRLQLLPPQEPRQPGLF